MFYCVSLSVPHFFPGFGPCQIILNGFVGGNLLVGFEFSSNTLFEKENKITPRITYLLKCL